MILDTTGKRMNFDKLLFPLLSCLTSDNSNEIFYFDEKIFFK